MSTQPFSFKLPFSRFDVGLLPGDARQIGSDRFKDAVIAHFVAQYAGKGDSALVTFDNDEIRGGGRDGAGLGGCRPWGWHREKACGASWPWQEGWCKNFGSHQQR